ncbi:MAG TPA: DoxX family protein [Ferruginibacter sp.]|nr:DoxX family protein [Ferruginibacter sp.]
MKKTHLVYWISTSLIFLFEGVMPALTGNSELAKEGIRHLGYPDYFRVMLTVFKVIGALVLILPMVPSRIKEWAYAGFTFTLISAFVSHAAVDGINGQTFFPLIVLAVLLVSYISYRQRIAAN